MDISGKQFQPRFLTESEYERCRAWIVQIAQHEYNPYPAVYEKIKFLPDDDRRAAVAEMMKTTYPIPSQVFDAVGRSVKVVRWLVKTIFSCTQADVEAAVTDENVTYWIEETNKFLKPVPVVFTGTAEEKAAALEAHLAKTRGV